MRAVGVPKGFGSGGGVNLAGLDWWGQPGVDSVESRGIDANQLGRRNLSPDAFRLLLGRRYNRVKKAHGAELGGRGNQHTVVKAQIEPLPEQHKPPIVSPKPASTAETLAIAHGVSRETIKRAAKFAAEVAKNPRLQAAIENNVPVLHVRHWTRANPVQRRQE
ncbi:MAG: hypothetical protein HQL77_14160 [Magnetococcales bacterium]|nr:hypothetical protein [Magnetococcales bacterium]